MRLAVFLNQPVLYRNGLYLTKYPYLLDFFAQFHADFDEVRLCVPLGEAVPSEKVTTLSLPNNVRLEALPFYEGEREVVGLAPRVVWHAWQLAFRQAAECDVVGYVSPSLIGCLFATAATLRGRRQCEFIRGDKLLTIRLIYRDGVRRSFYAAGVRALDAWMYTLRCVGKIITFTFGDSLKRKYELQNPKRVVSIAPVLGDGFLVEPKQVRKNPEYVHSLPIVLYVGRVSREKGLDYLLEAAAQLWQTEGMDFVLRLVGEGPIRGELECWVRERGLESYVQFAGFVQYGQDLIAEYDAADVVVLPSLTEGVPGVILEAMARYVPIIATRVGALEDIVENRRTGLLVRPRDVRELADAIRLLVRQPQVRAELAKNAYERAREFTFGHQYVRMRSMLWELFPELKLEPRHDRMC